MPGPTFIFAGGGTGGHLYPGLAVAEALAERQPEARVVFACSDRAIDSRILGPLDYPFTPQPVRPIRGNPLCWPRFLRGWRASTKLARTLLSDLRPAAALGLGGFAAGPVVKVAAGRSLPAALLNPDAVPGKANRYLAGHVETIFTQHEATAGHFGEAGRKCRCEGCPIRPGLLGAERAEAVASLGLLPDRRTLLVFGGSMLARSLSEAFCAMAGDFDELSERWQLLLLAGPMQRTTAQHYSARAVHAVVLEYCRRMDLAYAAADLAVCRGGAGTVAELAATQTPAVILPYPYHADRQQYHNAEALVRAGAGLIVEDRRNAALTAEGLRAELLPLMQDAERLERMRAAAGELARPGAAGAVADWLLGKADGQTG